MAFTLRRNPGEQNNTPADIEERERSIIMVYAGHIAKERFSPFSPWAGSLGDDTIAEDLLTEMYSPPKSADWCTAPKRKQNTSWKDFIRAHMAVMVGTDFFTVEVLTLKGLKTYYVLFFLHLESRRICLAGLTQHPDQEWMEQMAHNVTMEGTGFLTNCRYLLHDRDSKYCVSFRQLIEAEKVKVLVLPKSPNLNAFAERWVRSVKAECLSKLILFGERSLKRALHHYEAHYHQERNHQGKDNQRCNDQKHQPLVLQIAFLCGDQKASEK